MRIHACWAAAALLGGLFTAKAAEASYPAGVWVKPQKVVVEKTNPARIQIHGAAMVYDGSTNTTYYGYTEPGLGYLYYECPANQSSTCAQEWADVEKNVNAPANECVGLGDQKVPTGTLRTPGTPLGKADAYPIAMGVLPGYVPCEILASFLAGEPDAGIGTGGGAAGSPASGGSGGAPIGTGGTSAGTGGKSTAGSGNQALGESGSDGGCSLTSAPASAGWSLAALLGLLAIGIRRART